MASISDSDSFTALLNEVLREDAAWTSSELGDILRHLLDGPPGRCIMMEGIETATTVLSALCGKEGGLAVLQRLKDFAKACRAQPGRLLPEPVAAVIYFSAIAAALVHQDTRISSHNDLALKDGMTWAINQQWLDPALRKVLEKAQAKLATS